jgi:hypothetical protein
MQYDELLTVEEAATRLKISKHTLNRWRVTGEGPPLRQVWPAASPLPRSRADGLGETADATLHQRYGRRCFRLSGHPACGGQGQALRG